MSGLILRSPSRYLGPAADLPALTLGDVSLVADFVSGIYARRNLTTGALNYGAITDMFAVAGGPVIMGGTDGYLRTVPDGGARIGTDDATVIKGLWAAAAAKNLLLYSQDFANAAWTKTGVTVDGSAVLGPDNTASAYRLNEGTANSAHNVAAAAGENVTISNNYYGGCYVAPNAGTLIQIALGSTRFGANAWASFNPATGAIVNQGSAVVKARARMQRNGFWRFSVTAPATSTGAGGQVVIGFTNDAAVRFPSYTGTSRIVDIYGAALVNSSTEHPLIPTTGAMVTSAGQTVIRTGGQDWYNPVAGSWMVEAYADDRTYTSGTASAPFSFDDGTATYVNYIGRRNTSPQNQAIAGISNGLAVTLGLGTWNDGALMKVGMSYDGINFLASDGTNTASGAVSTPLGTVPSILRIGTRHDGTPWRGWVKRIRYIPYALPTASLL